jgi:hypothetical protein
MTELAKIAKKTSCMEIILYVLNVFWKYSILVHITQPNVLNFREISNNNKPLDISTTSRPIQMAWTPSVCGQVPALGIKHQQAKPA